MRIHSVDSYSVQVWRLAIECWIPSQELNMLRRVLNLRRKPDEPFDKYNLRKASLIGSQVKKNSLQYVLSEGDQISLQSWLAGRPHILVTL